MEFQSGGCRDVGAVFLALLIGLVAVACGLTVLKVSDQATERAQIESNERIVSQQIQAQLELDKMRVAEANFEQRIGTIAVALAGLRSGNSGGSWHLVLGFFFAVFAFFLLKPVLEHFADWLIERMMGEKR